MKSEEVKSKNPEYFRIQDFLASRTGRSKGCVASKQELQAILDQWHRVTFAKGENNSRSVLYKKSTMLKIFC